VIKFRSSGDSTSNSTENELKTITPRGRKIMSERVAIVKSRMSKRGIVVHSCVAIARFETASNSSRYITNMRFTESRHTIRHRDVLDSKMTPILNEQ
jgi:hypothetical protein